MSDNDGYNVAASKIRQQIMVKDPFVEYKPDPAMAVHRIKILMKREGLSVSEAIKKYTSMCGAL